MAIYRNKSGEVIDSLQWQRLSRLPHYCVVARSKAGDGDIDVCTSWVGIEFDGHPGSLFLTWVRRDRSVAARTLMEKWTNCCKDAIEAHMEGVAWANSYLKDSVLVEAAP